MNGATCVETSPSTCICPGGYQGSYCEVLSTGNLEILEILE